MTRQEIPAASAPTVAPSRSNRLRRLSGGALSLAVVVGVFWFFLPQFADISDVWRTVRAMTELEVASLVIAALVNLASYGWVMTASMPGLTFRQAVVVTESSTALSNTLPAGAAVGIATSCAMWASWGFSQSRVTVALLVSGMWNNFVKLGMPLVALACLAVEGGASTGRLLAALAGVLALVAAVALATAVLHSEATAERTGRAAARLVSALRRPLGRGPVHGWERATKKFRARTVLLVRARWLHLTLATTASHLALFAVLLLCLRHVGVDSAQVSWAEALAVFAFARLVTAIPVTPGGVGIVEIALITGLAAADGAHVEVVAAVLAFRALTYVLPIPLGVLTWVFWRRNRSWRRAPGAAPRTPLVPET